MDRGRRARGCPEAEHREPRLLEELGVNKSPSQHEHRDRTPPRGLAANLTGPAFETGLNDVARRQRVVRSLTDKRGRGVAGLSCAMGCRIRAERELFCAGDGDAEVLCGGGHDEITPVARERGARRDERAARRGGRRERRGAARRAAARARARARLQKRGSGCARRSKTSRSTRSPARGCSPSAATNAGTRPTRPTTSTRTRSRPGCARARARSPIPTTRPASRDRRAPRQILGLRNF